MTEKIIRQTDDLFIAIDVSDDPGMDVVGLKLKMGNFERVRELRMVLERALGTWEPEKRPSWVLELQDALSGMAGMSPGQIPTGTQKNALCAERCISRVDFKRDFCLCLNEDRLPSRSSVL